MCSVHEDNPSTHEPNCGLSFIIPAYNEEQAIGRAIEAIQLAAAPSNLAYEIIVVNDASTDDTPLIAEARGARVLHVAHRHIAPTRNAGARAARGAALFFVDADTIATAPLVLQALAALKSGAVGGGAPMRFDGRVPLYARLLQGVTNMTTWALGVAGGCFLFCSRDTFHLSGGFDEGLFAGEDIALCAALKRHGRFAVLRKHVVTSGRKMRTHHGLQILAMMLRGALKGRAAFEKREQVSALWYTRNVDATHVSASTLRKRLSNMASLAVVVGLLSTPLILLLLQVAPDGRWATASRGCVRAVLYCAGLTLWPISAFLLRTASRQLKWGERIKLAGLGSLAAAVACLSTAGLGAVIVAIARWWWAH